jgi:MFS family permease
MVQMASSNTLLQTLVDDDKRGRIMAFYTMAFMGTAPFGSLFAGNIAGIIGVPYTIFIGGVVCLLGTFIFVKDIHSAKDLMPPLAKEATLSIERGIESSEEVNESM